VYVLRSSRKVYGIALALVALVLAWSAFWKIASSATNAALDDWFAAERAAGRVWSCAERSIGGFPFRIAVRCAQPTFSGVVARARVTGSTGDIIAAAHVTDPNLILAEIASPLRVEGPLERGSLALEWRELHVGYRSRDGAPQLGSLDIVAPRLKIIQGPTNLDLSADTLDLTVGPEPSQATDGVMTLSIKGAVVPLLDGVTRENAPLDLAILATVGKIDAFSHPSGGPPAERWRRAGGNLRLTRTRVTKGGLVIDATGALDLDDAHRPRGNIDIAADGLSPLLDRFGVPASVLAIGSLLSGGNKNDGRPNGARLSLSLRDGRASLGPIRLPVAIAPLY
jgi:hypothetical protein